MSLPSGPVNLLTWAFAAERLDISVLKGSIVFYPGVNCWAGFVASGCLLGWQTAKKDCQAFP